MTLLSGFPFTPQDGSNRSGDGDTRNPDRPNINPAFTGPVITGNPTQWYNPAAFQLNRRRHLWRFGPRSLSGARSGGSGTSRSSKTCAPPKGSHAAVPRRIFQHPQPRQLRHSERHRLLRHLSKSVGRPHHNDRDRLKADSIRPEADLLIRPGTCGFQPRCAGFLLTVGSEMPAAHCPAIRQTADTRNSPAPSR